MIKAKTYHISPAKAVCRDIQTDCGYIIISTDKKYEWLFSNDNVLILQFADTEEANKIDAFSCIDARRILSIIDLFPFEDIFVACDAGESRSPAIVAGLLMIAGMDDNYIWKSKDYRPNVHVYRTILECFRELPYVKKELKTIDAMTPDGYREYRARDILSLT